MPDQGYQPPEQRLITKSSYYRLERAAQCGTEYPVNNPRDSNSLTSHLITTDHGANPSAGNDLHLGSQLLQDQRDLTKAKHIDHGLLELSQEAWLKSTGLTDSGSHRSPLSTSSRGPCPDGPSTRSLAGAASQVQTCPASCHHHDSGFRHKAAGALVSNPGRIGLSGTILSTTGARTVTLHRAFLPSQTYFLPEEPWNHTVRPFCSSSSHSGPLCGSHGARWWQREETPDHKC